MESLINDINEISSEPGLSDIHVHSNKTIVKRINGQLNKGNQIIAKKIINTFIDKFLDTNQKVILQRNKSIDISLTVNNIRYRANIFFNIHGPALALRKIESSIPQFSELGIPEIIYSNSHFQNGLILVTGPTGSGKTTSLASIINRINESSSKHIITIEDPIEFIHDDKNSIISQREIGKDAICFASALRAALREDPDIILVGELRDTETISLALTAAETGHLVLGTLHTNGAPNTVNRIIDVFPSNQQNQIRGQLSQCLRLVMTQQLIKLKNDNKRQGIFEIMLCNNPISNLIRENKIFQIKNIMETSMQLGMITMEKALNVAGYEN